MTNKMQNESFLKIDRRVLISTVFLLLVISATFWLGSQTGMPAPEITLADDGQMGAYGPFVLEFHAPVAADEFEKNIRLEPSVAGKWAWNETKVSFWPDAPFQIGQTYTLTLLKGLKDETGRSLRADESWTFTIRNPAILYLGQATTAPEIWLADEQGRDARQLTQSGGKILDFAAFPGGSQVVYSATNEQGGADLWLVDPGNGSSRKLLDCAADRCTQPAVAPDESAITFSRTREGAPLGEIWLFDMSSGESEALYKDRVVSGINPDWSPQGQYLQFYDPEFSQIHILDLKNNRVSLVPTNLQGIGSWSPDGQKLLITRSESTAIGVPYVDFYEVNLASGEVELIHPADLGQVDASRPIYTPDGTALVMALRGLVDSPNKQLWLAPLEDRDSQPITDDPGASYAAYSWDSSGTKLLFQRFQLESSQSKPQVMIWQKDTRSFIEVAQDAARPQWLP